MMMMSHYCIIKQVIYLFGLMTHKQMDRQAWLLAQPDRLFFSLSSWRIAISRPLIAKDKLFHRQNAVRNFLISSTWPAYPIHMTCLSNPRDSKL